MIRAFIRESIPRSKALFIFGVLIHALSLSLLVSGCSHLAYQPSHLLYYTPKSVGLEGVEIEVPVADPKDPDAKVFVWYLRGETPKGLAIKDPKGPKGMIVQFHGNAENMSSHYLSLAWLVKEGYSLVTFDYRGYGKSPGQPSQEHTYQDGLAVLAKAWELRERDIPNKKAKFIVVGQSLGGAVAARTLPDSPVSDHTSLLVLDSTFMSYQAASKGLLNQHWWSAPAALLTGVLMSDEYASTEAIKNLRTRLLVIHDRRDPVVAFENGQEIFELAGSALPASTKQPGKDIWVLDRGRHVGVFSKDETERRADFIKFLDVL